MSSNTEAIERFNRKMQAQASYVDHIETVSRENRIEGAAMLVEGLMRGDREELRLGYGIGSALISTLETFERWGIPLTYTQIGVLVEKIAEPKDGIVEYGPTSRG